MRLRGPFWALAFLVVCACQSILIIPGAIKRTAVNFRYERHARSMSSILKLFLNCISASRSPKTVSLTPSNLHRSARASVCQVKGVFTMFLVYICVSMHMAVSVSVGCECGVYHRSPRLCGHCRQSISQCHFSLLFWIFCIDECFHNVNSPSGYLFVCTHMCEYQCMHMRSWNV